MLIRGAPRRSRGRKGGQAETRATRRRDASVSETLASRSRSMTAGEMKLFLYLFFFQCFYFFFLAKKLSEMHRGQAIKWDESKEINADRTPTCK